MQEYFIHPQIVLMTQTSWEQSEIKAAHKVMWTKGQLYMWVMTVTWLTETDGDILSWLFETTCFDSQAIGILKLADSDYTTYM